MQSLKLFDSTITLNPQQYEAVVDTKTNSLIVAGAGGGKTRCLISKIAYILQQNPELDPRSIVAITFTKKAHQEMKQRLTDLLGSQLASSIYLGTIHSFAYRSMQKHRKIFYNILDEKDAQHQMIEIFNNNRNQFIKKAFNLKLKSSDFSDISKFSNIKYNGKYINLIELLINFTKQLYNIYQTARDNKYPTPLSIILGYYGLRDMENLFNLVLEEYQDYKKKHKYLDFPDIMHQFNAFLKKPDGQSIKQQIKYIFVDESQDLNHIQFEIIQQLNQMANNCSFYGDDWQAIYRFRGGHVQYMLNFRKYFTPNRVHTLEYNYRSTPEIINFCSKVISKNPRQIKKSMLPVRATNFFKPKVISLKNDTEEVNFVISEIKSNVSLLSQTTKSSQPNYSEIAILTRTNNLLEKYELALVKAKIPYRKIGGVPLLQRAHVKDMMAYLIVTEKSSEFHWRRVLMSQKSMDESTITQLMYYIKNGYCSSSKKNMDHKISTIIKNPRKYLTLDPAIYSLKEAKKASNIAKKLNIFSHWFKNIMAELDWKKRVEAVAQHISESIIANHNDKELTSLDNKLNDIEQLVSTIMEYNSVNDFIRDIHLDLDGLEKEKNNNDDLNESENIITLSTVHSSKGLEWSMVFVSDASSTYFPCHNSLNFDDAMEEYEEERRLFFVACSRSKDRLYITYSEQSNSGRFFNNYKNKNGFGNKNETVYITPFVTDIDVNDYISVSLRKKQLMSTNTKAMKGNLTSIISNFIAVKTPTTLSPYLSIFQVPSEYRRSYNIYDKHYEYPRIIEQNKLHREFGSYLDNVIGRIIYQSYDEQRIQNFPLLNSLRCKEQPSYIRNYLDKHQSLQDCIPSIIKMSLTPQQVLNKFNNSSISQIDPIAKDCLVQHFEENPNFYKEIYNALLKLIGNTKDITIHDMVSFGDIKAELDFTFGTTLVEVKTSKYNIIKLPYVIQSLCYVYLLRKTGRTINRLVLFNPASGEIEEFDLHNWHSDSQLYNAIMNIN